MIDPQRRQTLHFNSKMLFNGLNNRYTSNSVSSVSLIIGICKPLKIDASTTTANHLKHLERIDYSSQTGTPSRDCEVPNEG